MPQPRQKTVNLNVKVTETTIRALSRTAALRDTTQKEVLMRAMLKAGIEVDPQDLGEKRTVPWHERP
ncbi:MULTISPECIES: hypothetical protein [Acetobacteraceae]|uniref:Uncharacterized protein n=2 Tax=Acetobacteraceae TaxID=433 RepID=A0A7X1SRW9_9PROT|nr:MULTISPECIES: hypothetical protein [Acetobacteraceae]KXV29024.1 hypothetical protein AD937_01335 [Gluconobacter japonicus]MBO1329483.1 hypothetical protein [Acetobacter suratthaniensis]MCX2567548.1 hypothetical protein [Acetobacter suratthaniensis]MQS00082.1 hypothetical protein [Gluconobacter aidae]